jgi:hypothetical protein
MTLPGMVLLQRSSEDVSFASEVPHSYILGIICCFCDPDICLFSRIVEFVYSLSLCAKEPKKVL